MNRQKMNDVFPNWLTGTGIFSALQSFPVPWAYDNIDTSLDLEYFGNISGEKFVSPLVNKMKAGLTLTDAEIKKLAGVIYTMYGVNWEREWNSLFYEYNPIDNYSMTEQMTDDTTVTQYGRTHTKTDDLELKKTGTVTDNLRKTGTDTNVLTKTGTEALTPNTTDTGSTSTYGFNSTNAVPSGASSNTKTGSETTTYNTTDNTTVTYNTTDANTTTYNTTDKDSGTVTDADTGTDTNTRNYTLTRKGNVGVTTSQQMIQSDRDLYMWNFFYTVVFPDIDKVLTLGIY